MTSGPSRTPPKAAPEPEPAQWWYNEETDTVMAGDVLEGEEAVVMFERIDATEADGHLASAAPEMRKALDMAEDVLTKYTRDPDVREALTAIRKAITKANGPTAAARS